MAKKVKDKTKTKKVKKVPEEIVPKDTAEVNDESSDDEKVEDELMESTDDIIKSIDESGNKSDSDGDAEDTKESNADKQQERKQVYDKEDEDKTVFCGNVPNDPNVTKGRIKDLFAQFGPVKSIRLRTENGNVIFSKKVKKYCKSFNAYVVFENEDDAKKSVELNGHKLVENHLRVNMANNKQSFTNKGTIFVGNLPFDSAEADIHAYFSQIGEIEYVRKLPKKGIAFICYKKGVSLINALKLNDTEFQGRKLRVSRSESKDKQEKKKLFKKDPKTGKVVRQKVKKSHKLNEKLIKGRPNINNPIVKKIKDSQKAKFNKFTDSEVSKKELFRPGGKMDKDNRQVNREKSEKKQKFFGSKVDDTNSDKVKKGKVTKTAKQQKVIAKKLKSAALRTKT
ncbi:unnamed protein product [Chironomus riparius]|uniref:RRM domain-containing protein n=1 Tax=Chironomus riparius TaxID=315576 RepID=A0A9N9WML4_9DIPT|nr:unnamed protein product [Chironomus riparius]